MAATAQGRNGDSEQALFEAMRRAGAIIPQTVEDLRVARKSVDIDSVELPERIRDPRAMLDRVKAVEAERLETGTDDTPHVFGHLIEMLRRKKGLNLEQLAKRARINIQELERIEAEEYFEPKPRTVLQLAEFFRIRPDPLLRLANLKQQRDGRIVEGAYQFAAHANSVQTLTKDERRALDEFVRLLNDLD